MDIDDIKPNIFRGVIAFIVLIIGIIIGWNFLIYAGIVYIISDVIWTVGEYVPPVNAVFSALLGVASAITFVITKNVVHFFWILIWIGYFKSERLWGQIYVYDQYYSFLDDKIYDFVNQDSSLMARFIATLFVCAFYVILGSLAEFFLPLAFLPAIFLIYRAVRIIQIYRDNY